jgi:lysophospholipase L1-like esterase
MFRRVRPVVIVACALYAVPVSAEQPAVPLARGERIVFLGDSITQGGVAKGGYVTLVKDTLEVKHKNLGIEVIGAGISGNKVPDLQKRVERDVIAKKPTLVFIYIGINDVWHGEKDPARGTAPDKYEQGLKEIMKKITDAGARVVLCTPSVIGEKTDGSNVNDKKLDEYAEISRKVARELKVPVCDLRKAFIAHLKENNPTNKAKDILTTDGVHLNAVGNRFVAEQVMSMFGD